VAALPAKAAPSGTAPISGAVPGAAIYRPPPFETAFGIESPISVGSWVAIVKIAFRITVIRIIGVRIGIVGGIIGIITGIGPPGDHISRARGQDEDQTQ
jgi:hypothetical protein